MRIKPLFSIITVTYNAEHTIARTIDSVNSQTCRLYEHIIIDGRSTDGTRAMVKAHGGDRLRWLSEPDRGIYDAMNKGISLALGEYLIFLNAGDKFHSPDVLQLYADAIMDHDYPGIVYGQTDIVDDEGRRLGPRHLTAPAVLTLDDMKQGMVVCHQAMAVYHNIAVLYNLKYRYSADYEWVIITLQHSKRNVYIPQVVVDYLDQGATTAHHRESLKERFQIMCTYFGTLPTLWRHLKFMMRYLRRQRSGSANIQ